MYRIVSMFTCQTAYNALQNIVCFFSSICDDVFVILLNLELT